MENKPAISFRIGADHRKKLEAVSKYRGVSQTEVIRTMIDVAHKDMKSRKEARKARRPDVGVSPH